MRRRSRVGSRPAARSPATSTSPVVGSSNRLMSFKVVVFPDPLRPSKTRVSPTPTVKDTFCTRFRPLAGSAYPSPRTSRVAVTQAPEGVGVVLVGAVQLEPLSGGQHQRLAAHMGRDVARRAEVFGERVQAGEPSVHAVLENELAVLLGDADRDERCPGETAVERVVVARDGLLSGVDLAVHEQ